MLCFTSFNHPFLWTLKLQKTHFTVCKCPYVYTVTSKANRRQRRRRCKKKKIGEEKPFQHLNVYILICSKAEAQTHLRKYISSFQLTLPCTPHWQPSDPGSILLMHTCEHTYNAHAHMCKCTQHTEQHLKKENSFN